MEGVNHIYLQIANNFWRVLNDFFINQVEGKIKPLP